MRGRKPKPTALKILDGTRSDRINEHEPKIAAPVDLRPPAWLEVGDATDHWAELAPILAAASILTAADRQALAMLCDAFRLIRLDPTDIKARDLYRRFSAEFGLTPSARSRLRLPAEKPTDELGEFLKRRKAK